MGTTSSSLGTVLKMIPPRSALKDVPAHNGRRRMLCELNLFFAKKFELNGGGTEIKTKFQRLAVSLAKTETGRGFDTLHEAATFMATRPDRGVADLRPETLSALLDAVSPYPAIFLSVVKALDNASLTADADLVDKFHSFQMTIHRSTHGKRTLFGSGLSLAMLENPSCRNGWITYETAFQLAIISNNLWTGSDFGLGFGQMAGALRKPGLSPSRLVEIAELSSDRKNVSMMLQ
ncbi:MAG: hypothetical protein PHV13_01665 [Candidatus ainarchaeum sp.]|nr:hypothetical protein [Candidatus ainarchaeum sp.]